MHTIHKRSYLSTYVGIAISVTHQLVGAAEALKGRVVLRDEGHELRQVLL